MKRLLICLLLGLACGVTAAGQPLLAQAAPGYDPYQDAHEDLDEQRQIDWERGYSTPSEDDPTIVIGVVLLVIILVGIFVIARGQHRDYMKSTRGLGDSGSLKGFLKGITNYGLWRACRDRSRTSLDLTTLHFTDAGLVLLEDMKSLTSLDLDYREGVWNNYFTDAGLKHLKGLTSLTWLRISGGNITGVGLEHLKGLTNLENLSLSYTGITGASLVHLKGMKSLKKLTLRCRLIGDDGLEHLKGLTDLTELYLYGTQITDAGLEHLKGLVNLRKLTLDGTKITDEGLFHLMSLPKLDWLDLIGIQWQRGNDGAPVLLITSDTQITDAGVAKLDCRIPKVF